jgi:hypothetical protein
VPTAAAERRVCDRRPYDRRVRIVARAADRFEDQVAAVPGGWVTASARALVRWVDGVPGEPLPCADAGPGPVTWLPGPGALAWGPTVLDGERARWAPGDVASVGLADLGVGGVRVFDLVVAAVAGDARQVVAAYRRPQPRRRGAQVTGETTRVTIVDPLGGDLVETVPGRLPTSVRWGGPRLVLGYPGAVAVREPGGRWWRGEWDDPTAATALHTDPGGDVVVGTASGQLVRFDGGGTEAGRWRAHEGPVTAVAGAGDVLASGGADGAVRSWVGGTLRDEVDAGGAVGSLAWTEDDRVIALRGGPGGMLLVLAG